MKANTLSPGKRVRFGAATPSSNMSSETTLSNPSVNNGTGFIARTGLPILDETKHHSPNTLSASDLHRSNQLKSNGLQNNNSGSLNSNNSNKAPQNYHHASILPRANTLNTPTPNHYFATSDSQKTVLIRSSSVRSDASEQDMETQYTANYPRYYSRAKSYDHTPQTSFSDAATVVVRSNTEEARWNSHTPYTSQGNLPLSPVMPPMPPIPMDMRTDLNILIETLSNAKCANNANFDDYHEALVCLTSNWDRERSEKTLKYINSKHNGTNFVVLDLLGVLNAQLGRTEDAIKYHCDSIRVSRNQYIEGMHNYAYLLHRIGDKENDELSITYYKMALNINSKFAHCWLHFGNLLEDSGKMKEALEMYRKAIAMRPNNAAFHLDLANVLDDLNDYESASVEYLKCIQLQPSDPVYHWNYAISLENQCFYHKAEDAYKRAIALDFHCVDARLNYAHMLENQPTPQLRKALQQYDVILSIPEMMNDVELMSKCAKLYEHFGDNQKTEQMFMNILQIDPNLEDVYIEFATYLTNQKRIEDANACYQAGIRQIQSQKLQQQYIEFLKDINTLYKTRSAAPNKPAHISTASSASTSYANGRTVPPSPFVTSMKADAVGGTDGYDMGYDYYKPAQSKAQQGSNNAKPPKTMTANGDEPGCIVM